jgi:glycosyltransferase involved in cell wall biosynthesis
LRIVSDIHVLERAGTPGVEIIAYSATTHPRQWRRNLRLLWRALRADYLVVHFSFAEVLFFTTALFLIPFHRCRVITLDFFVSVPRQWLPPIIRFALRRVALLLVYFRDRTRFQDVYGVPPSKFRFVPFKVNAWELVQTVPVTDQGYIFVGGRSRRDFRTLFEAVKDLPYPVKVLTAHEADIRPHGSTMEGLTPPQNVSIFYNDTDATVFVNMIAGARLVVLPITKETRIQAGISVCLQALALRKCVIVSEALGISDVLTNGEVCTVPPGDASALRAAIQALWDDSELRRRYGEAGHRYAWPLGGEDDLRRKIVDAVIEFDDERRR